MQDEEGVSRYAGINIFVRKDHICQFPQQIFQNKNHSEFHSGYFLNHSNFEESLKM